MAAHPLGILAGALPAGLLAGRLGPRACVLLGLAVTAAAVLAPGWSSALGALAATRFARAWVGHVCGSAGWRGSRPPDMSALKLLPPPAALRDRAVGTGVALTMLAGMTIGALEVLAWARDILAICGASNEAAVPHLKRSRTRQHSCSGENLAAKS